MAWKHMPVPPEVPKRSWTHLPTPPEPPKFGGGEPAKRHPSDPLPKRSARRRRRG